MTASVWMILTVILLMAVAGVLSTVETAVSAISGISNNYDGMRLGYKLEKQ